MNAGWTKEDAAAFAWDVMHEAMGDEAEARKGEWERNAATTAARQM